MRVAYIRVSTTEQNTDRQDVMMRDHEIEKTYMEKLSGKNTDRPELQKMLEYVTAGDVVYVESISRLARSTRDLLSIIEQLSKKHVEFISLKENIDTTTPQGRFVLTIFAALAELERETILQRQKEGIAAAKAAAKATGRPKVKPPNYTEIISKWRTGQITGSEAYRSMGISQATFYRLTRAALQASTSD